MFEFKQNRLLPPPPPFPLKPTDETVIQVVLCLSKCSGSLALEAEASDALGLYRRYNSNFDAMFTAPTEWLTLTYL